MASAHAHQGWPARLGPTARILFPKYRAKRSRRRVADSLARKPLYIGLSAVEIGKRFDVKGAAKQAAAQLPSLYAKHLKD